MELRLFKARRERQLDERVSEIAGAAVLEALEVRGEGTSMPFRIQIPPRPGRLKPEEYLERIQNGVSTTLGEMGCEGVVECDEEMTGLVNAGIANSRASTNVFTRLHRNDLPLLVFRAPQST